MSPELTKLLYKTQLKVYYQMYNIIELFNFNSFWYCFCKKFPGCRSQNGNKVYNHLIQIFNYDETISELWNADFSCRGGNYAEGTEWDVFLIDAIEFRFNKIEL